MGINGGVVYNVTPNLHLDLEYFRAEGRWWLGETASPAHGRRRHDVQLVGWPAVKLMPTGGVNVNTAAAYIEAGAVALGVGSELARSRWPWPAAKRPR